MPGSEKSTMCRLHEWVMYRYTSIKLMTKYKKRDKFAFGKSRLSTNQV